MSKEAFPTAAPFLRPIVEPLAPETTQTRILVTLLDLSESMNRTRQSLERIEARLGSLEQTLSRLEFSSRLERTVRTWISNLGPETLTTVGDVHLSNETRPPAQEYYYQPPPTERLVKDAGRIAIYSKVGIPVAKIGLVGSLLVATAILLLTGLFIPSIPFLIAAAFCFYSYRFFKKELKPLRLAKHEKEPARGSGSH